MNKFIKYSLITLFALLFFSFIQKTTTDAASYKIKTIQTYGTGNGQEYAEENAYHSKSLKKMFGLTMQILI